MTRNIGNIKDGIRKIFWISRPKNDQEIALMRDQCNLLFLLCLLFPAAGVPNLILNSFAFGLKGNIGMFAVMLSVCFFYAAILGEAFYWKRNQNDFRFLRHSQFLYVGLGLAWGTMLILFAQNGRPDQTVLLLGLAAGVVSTPIISVPFAVALAFFIPDALLSIYAIVFVMPNGNFFSALSFVSFTAYAAVGITFNNIHFGGRSAARAALQREINTVNVFLREYEEGSSDWLWHTDPFGRIERAAPRMLEATGLSPEALNGRLLASLVANTENRTHGRTRPQTDLATLLEEHRAFRELLVRYEGPNGMRMFLLTGHPIYDEAGEFTGYRGIGRDATADQEAQERINFLAAHDGLTGLTNRHTFLQTIDQMCMEKEPFSLLLIDLDRFKAINDTHGHYIGDRLLQAIAGRITHSLRPNDRAARLGGDEFAVLLHDTGKEEGLAVAERMAQSLCAGFRIDDLSVPSGASIGVSGFPCDSTDPDRLRVMADRALYKAKRDGRGRAFLYSPWIEEERRRLISEEIELQSALEQGEISVVYQPIVDIKSGTVVASEALVRWNHPSRGVVYPGEFIEIAERSDLMEALGELVLRTACHDATAWPEPIQVNVNLSPRQLQSGRFLQILTETLDVTGLPAERLAIEITESVLLEHDEKTMSQLKSLRELGVKLILDDFGTGYSSLTYLHNVEVNGLKVDATFTQKLSDHKVKVIYRTIARMAMDLNIYVVAEGVEEADQLKWLDDNGVRFAQGFLLGRPSPAPPLKKAQFLS